MAVRASASVTLCTVRDVQAVHHYYKLQASTAAIPTPPTSIVTLPPSGWSATEPTYTAGSTNSLYTVDLTIFTDSTFNYSSVSLSSSYEAAKTAYNKAVAAANAASGAQTTANGKNTVFRQTSAPAATGRVTGDVWFDTDDGNRIYTWNGSAWASTQMGSAAIADLAISNAKIVDGTIANAKIANLDAGKITTGTISADRIAAGSLVVGKLSDGLQSTINTASSTASTALASANSAKAYTDAVQSAYGYQYKTDIVINGESNKWYPVVLGGGNQNVMREIMVLRGFNEQAPSDWNTATHKGGLTLKIKCNYGGWGGISYSWYIHDLEETYSYTFGGQAGVISGLFFYIYLRGGGTTGAIYHLYSDQPLTNSNSYMDGTFPAICLNSDSVGYSIGNGTASAPQYVFKAPPPLSEVDAESKRKKLYIPLTQQIDSNIANWCYNNDRTYINGGKLYTGTVTANQIAANTITGSKIAGTTITASNLATGAVTTDKLDANAVTAAKIAAGTITASQISSKTITGDKIAVGTIAAENLGANSVTSDKIVSGNITTDKLAAKAVTANNMAANSITAANAALADASIVNAKIVDVDAGKIKSGYISADRIAAGTLAIGKLADDLQLNISTNTSGLASLSENLSNNYTDTTTMDSTFDDIRQDLSAASIANWCWQNNLTYIDGGKIYAKSVTSQAIDVDNLSAISANLGTVTTGVIQSPNYASGGDGVELDFRDSNNNGLSVRSNTKNTMLKIDADGTRVYSNRDLQNPVAQFVDTGVDVSHVNANSAIIAGMQMTKVGSEVWITSII